MAADRARRGRRCACTTRRAGRSSTFEPADHVLMYTCGITPYDATHLGHAATFLAYDVLQRRLIDRGHTVTCVRNVTDVDDPLFAKARQLGIHYLDLAAGEEARFEADMEALNALPVASAPRASSAIPDIRGFIGMVLDRGFAYQAGGAVYFDVTQVRRRSARSATTTRRRCSALARQRGGDVDNPAQAPPARLRAVAAVGRTTSRRGTRCGGRAGRAGTSSAAPSPCASWARRSTCTAAAPT